MDKHKKGEFLVGSGSWGCTECSPAPGRDPRGLLPFHRIRISQPEGTHRDDGIHLPAVNQIPLAQVTDPGRKTPLALRPMRTELHVLGSRQILPGSCPWHDSGFPQPLLLPSPSGIISILGDPRRPGGRAQSVPECLRFPFPWKSVPCWALHVVDREMGSSGCCSRWDSVPDGMLGVPPRVPRSGASSEVSISREIQGNPAGSGAGTKLPPQAPGKAGKVRGLLRNQRLGPKPVSAHGNAPWPGLDFP